MKSMLAGMDLLIGLVLTSAAVLAFAAGAAEKYSSASASAQQLGDALSSGAYVQGMVYVAESTNSTPLFRPGYGLSNFSAGAVGSRGRILTLGGRLYLLRVNQ